jgi:succinoglycan biosynthesis transport protein ExoP
MNLYESKRLNPGASLVLDAQAAEHSGASSAPSFVQIVLRRKGTIALFALGCGLTAFAITMPQTRLYRAHVSLEFAGLNDNVMNTRDVDPSATGDNSSQAFINTQARVLESKPLLERVVQKLKSTAKPGDSPSRKQALARLTPSLLSLRTQVRPVEVTKLIDIYVDSPDPDTAADLANAMASEYMSLSVEARWSATRQTAGWLSQQLNDARSKLEKAESALQDYARHSNLVFNGDDGSISQARLREIQDEYSRAQADRVAKQATFESLLANNPEGVTASLRDGALQDYQTKLSELNRQLADLSTTYQPSYPKVQRLQSQIDQLSSDYKRQHESVITRLQNDYKTAARREEMLAKSYQSQQGVVTREAATTVDYNILKREADTNRTIYEGMLQRVKSYGIASAIQPSNVRVIDPAEAPSYPYKPNVALITTFGIMGGLFMGLVWVGVRDKGEINIEYPGQTQAVLQANELGVVPSARLDPYIGKKRLREVPSPLGALGSPSSTTLHKRFETAMWFCKSSLVAESIRSIRTSMLSAQGNSEGSRITLFTSLGPGHGKTSIVSNLGIAYSELGMRVLIIDADIRSPGLHRVFGLNNERGLTTVLQDPKPVTQQSQHLPVQPTDVPFLSLLSSGPYVAGTSSSSLFHSDRMARLLEHLRGQYDTILIDTPPLTLSDARILGPMSDGVVIVLRAGAVRLDSVLAVEQRLANDGSQVLGTVLNDWDPRSNGYGVYPERYHKSAYFKTA